MPEINLDGRLVGDGHPPLVIAEIGINHDGDFKKAKQMIDDAHSSNAECVKFQSHIIEDEMIEHDVIPENASESIWAIMKKSGSESWMSRLNRVSLATMLCSRIRR